MENFKGTKGEWFLEESDFTIRCKESIGESDCMGDYRGNIIADIMESLGGLNRTHAIPEVKANAKLLVAAPELLEELQQCVRALKVMYSHGATKPIIERAENVINRALGQ